MRIHGHKPFECVKCLRSFGLRADLERHQKTYFIYVFIFFNETPYFIIYLKMWFHVYLQGVQFTLFNRAHAHASFEAEEPQVAHFFIARTHKHIVKRWSKEEDM
jgi:hypothetical protein